VENLKFKVDAFIGKPYGIYNVKGGNIMEASAEGRQLNECFDLLGLFQRSRTSKTSALPQTTTWMELLKTMAEETRRIWYAKRSRSSVQRRT
jgi:hypothetical protein